MTIDRNWWALPAAACITLAAAAQDAPNSSPDINHGIMPLNGTSAQVMSMEREGRTIRLYGNAFSRGATPQASVDKFLLNDADAMGVEAEDLVPFAPYHVQPMMYEPSSDSYRFTGIFYSQARGGITVFRSKIGLLVRNEPGHPLVLATIDARDLGDFEPDMKFANDDAIERGRASALVEQPGLTDWSDPELTIYAGHDDISVTPRLAYIQTGTAGAEGSIGFRKWLFITDARTGIILHAENGILHVVEGNVSGMATQGVAVDVCAPEALEPMPYVRLDVGGTIVYADADGNYSVPGVIAPVTVTSAVRGLYFRVFNEGGADSSISQSATPPDVVDFVHNAANTSEFERAEVNAYIEANVARDFALRHNPAYPVIGGQTEFAVNVNINATCNATYSGNAINFYRAGSGCANTATAAIVHHEYGHHLVNVAGSGQGAYGEGMGDTVGVVILDDPGSAYGVFGDCGSPGRSAVNDCQYSESGCSTCGSQIHACGTVLSGSIWETRNELFLTEANYYNIIGNLTINSILLHSGTAVDPSITIDFLTLDDDNDTLFDGSPHYAEIAAGFGEHNMDAPPLAAVVFNFPDGRPELVNPGGGTTLRVDIAAISETPMPSSAEMIVDDGSGPQTVAMTYLGSDRYEVDFPASACGNSVNYYFTVSTSVGGSQEWPVGAPAERFTTVAATSTSNVVDLDFESGAGWTVENIALTDGGWSRGVPVGGGDRGDPATDYDGSGACWLTDNVDGNSDVDGGPTQLTSPVFDLSGETAVFVSFATWFTNDDLDEDRLDVYLSDNGGATWTLARSVANGNAWVEHYFPLSDYVSPTANVRIRFDATDNPNNSVTEGAVDALKFVSLSCEVLCPADIDGSGEVDFDDLVAILAAWGPCPGGCSADINNDESVDFDDLVSLLADWGVCG